MSLTSLYPASPCTTTTTLTNTVKSKIIACNEEITTTSNSRGPSRTIDPHPMELLHSRKYAGNLRRNRPRNHNKPVSFEFGPAPAKTNNLWESQMELLKKLRVEYLETQIEFFRIPGFPKKKKNFFFEPIGSRNELRFLLLGLSA